MDVSHFLTDIEGFVRDDGAIAVAVVLFLEAIGVPLPGESLLIFSGILAGKGELAPASLFAAAWVGAVAGDNAGFLIGRFVGRRLILHHGARVGLTAARYEKVEAAFTRYGPATVAAARFVAVLRQLNGLVAGTGGMAWRRFAIFDALGAALWVAVWGGGAYLFGGALESRLVPFAEHVAAHVGAPTLLAAAGLVLIVVAGVFVLRRRR